LLFIVFWSQFANWGVGDSIYPYACANAAPARKDGQLDLGETCVFQASFTTVFAELVGTHCAAIFGSPTVASLRLPLVAYTAVFALVCMAAVVGGVWASPLGLSKDKNGSYVVFLVSLLRVLGPFMRTMVTRLIQILYEPLVWDDVNFTLLALGTLSNVLGMLVGTIFVDSG